jgi:hypothetical protein
MCEIINNVPHYTYVYKKRKRRGMYILRKIVDKTGYSKKFRYYKINGL